MTDPSGMDTPSDIGTYLIWQQPHIIYLAELLRRAGRDVSQYAGLIDSTARFMTDFAVMDRTGRYILRGCIPAQETLKPQNTVNPPFELAYWKYGLNVARRWRISSGQAPDARTDDVLASLSPLASLDGVYLAAESAHDTWQNTDLTSDHPAMLGAYGMLPATDLVNPDVMNATLTKVLEEWHWERTWLCHVKDVPKWEDPCPVWDDKGNAYLGRSAHGAGPIILHRMSADGRELLDDGDTIYTGPVAEGTKFLRKDGWYYLIIPEGGVGQGWQTVLRSKDLYGPYERKVVLEQGPNQKQSQ